MDAQKAVDSLVRIGLKRTVLDVGVYERPAGTEERETIRSRREEPARRPQRVAEAVVGHLVAPPHEPRQMARARTREAVRLVSVREVSRVRKVARCRQLLPEDRLEVTSERVFQTMKFTDPEARRAVYGKRGNPKMTAKPPCRIFGCG